MKINTKRITLLELMSAIAIVGVLATVSLHAYTRYVQKSRHDELIRATRVYQTAVVGCIRRRKTPKGCNDNSHGIPKALHRLGHIASVRVNDGIITAKLRRKNGLKTETFRMTPQLAGSKVTWKTVS